MKSQPVHSLLETNIVPPARVSDRQKDLLRHLVRFVQESKLKEPIVPFPLREPHTHYVLHLRGADSFKFKHISDMDALADAGFLMFRWNRVGNTKLFFITKAGFKAVEYGFHLPPGWYGANTNLNEILTAMSGGLIQIEGLATHLDLLDIALDPVLRLDSVEVLIRALLAEAEESLPWKLYTVYSQTAVAFQQEILRARPDITRLKSLAAQLALNESFSGLFSFTLKSWAFIYPLLLIGHLRTHSER